MDENIELGAAELDDVAGGMNSSTRDTNPIDIQPIGIGDFDTQPVGSAGGSTQPIGVDDPTIQPIDL